MESNYTDCLQYIPDLKKYVKKCVGGSEWEDVVQDTLLYLFLKYDNINVTNVKGLLINTSLFFIKKHLSYNSKVNTCEINDTNIIIDYNNANIKIGKYNSILIDDTLFNNINRVSKSLFIPFQMQLNGKSIESIAKVLKINENTIKTRIRRCKSVLRENIIL
jgi:hypothetical protein